MSGAMQELRQSRCSVTLLVVGLARARAVHIPRAAAPGRRMVMLVRRMGVVGAVRVHGGFDVRHTDRGEIRLPTAARGVHSRGVLISSTFVLLHLENTFLNGRAYVEVPYATAPAAVDDGVAGVAGSGARLGVCANDVAGPAAARGIHTSIVCGVDGGDQVSIVFAPAYLRPGGR